MQTQAELERSSKSKKEDSQEDEVGGKRVREQAKRVKASRPGPSPPSPPLKGFKMLPTGNYSDSEKEEDYPKQNVQATCAKAKFACIQPDLKSDDEDQERLNVKPNFEMQDGGIIEYMHNINIMAFPDATSTLWLFQMRSSRLTSRQERLCLY